MNIKSLAYVVLFSFCFCLQGADEAITAAVKSSDIESLKWLLMPGTYVRLQDKKLYSSLAQQKTKETYMNLDAFGLADIRHGTMAFLKAAAALFFGYEFYNRMIEEKDHGKTGLVRDISLWNLVLEDVRPTLVAAPRESLERLGEIMKDNWQTVCYSVITTYFAAKSYDDLCSIANKDERHARYLRALAVESIVARVPVFEQ